MTEIEALRARLDALERSLVEWQGAIEQRLERLEARGRRRHVVMSERTR